MGLPPNSQSAAQQQAAALRQNMATLAGLSPAQLQALTHQPALAQALLQSRANGGGGGGGGGGNSNPQQEAFLASLTRQQQPGGGGGGGGSALDPGGNGNGNEVNVNPGFGQLPGMTPQDPSGQGVVDQQRRLSLAQVALHLAHNGISIDQV